MNEGVSTYAIGHLLAALRDKYSTMKEVFEYIDAVQKDIIENLPEFLGIQQESPQGVPGWDRTSSQENSYSGNTR